MVERVHDLVDPGLQGFEVGAGAGDAVAHDGLIHESFAECFAFQSVGDGGGEGDAGLAGDADRDQEAFVIEAGLLVELSTDIEGTLTWS